MCLLLCPNVVKANSIQKHGNDVKKQSKNKTNGMFRRLSNIKIFSVDIFGI